jgi:CheY-like chemotaxis protein
MHVFGYGTPGDKEHRGFDDFLADLHARTNPAAIMGRRLEEKRILWVDPSTDRNARGRKYLEDATRQLCTIDLARTPDEAIALLRAGDSYDLVITRWGHHPRGPADGEALLHQMRQHDVRVPVVVFASGDHAQENREVALRLGALEYTFDWDALYAVIDARFT